MIDVFYTMYSNLYHFTHFRMVLKLIFDMLALFCRIKAAKDNKSNSLKADFFAFRLLLSAGILMLVSRFPKRNPSYQSLQSVN